MRYWILSRVFKLTTSYHGTMMCLDNISIETETLLSFLSCHSKSKCIYEQMYYTFRITALRTFEIMILWHNPLSCDNLSAILSSKWDVPFFVVNLRKHRQIFEQTKYLRNVAKQIWCSIIYDITNISAKSTVKIIAYRLKEGVSIRWNKNSPRLVI